jgi:hypothetical protein
MPTISKLDRTNLKLLHAELDLAIFEVAKKYGISLKFVPTSFTDNEATFKLKIAVKSVDGIVMNSEREDYVRNADLFNLKPEWLDQSFEVMGKVYKIVGLKTSRRKNPVIVENKKGKQYVFSTDVVRRMMSPERVVSPGASAIIGNHKEIEKRVAEMRRDNPEMYYADGEYRASGMSEKQIYQHHYDSIARQLAGR